MKRIIFLSLVSLIFLTGKSYSQFDKTILQLGIGVSEPFGDMKGTYYQFQPLGSYQVLTVHPDLYVNNYGAKTGLNFFGSAKFNFDKFSITRGVLTAGFSTFNTFEQSKSGNIGVEVITINNQLDTILSSASYNYSFNNFNIGLGLEVSPLAFTNVVSPYFGASFNFNFFNTSLSRTENRIDSVSFKTSDFRIGVELNAGIEAKLSKTFGLVLGVKYNLGNLLLKQTASDIASRHEWGKTNATMNDEEGQFYSSLSNPVLTSTARTYIAKQKKINWGTVYLGINLYLSSKKTTKKPTKK